MKSSIIVKYSIKSTGIEQQNTDTEMLLTSRVKYYLEIINLIE